MAERELQPGTTLHGFTVTGRTDLTELNIELYELRHEATGAHLVHLANEDPNNLFAIGFRTSPQDSTGVAHILEHTVLCGSRRYPVRDPFFSMLRRSLNTFMNALTASDWTLYPFSSMNEKDFYNLMDIYLDAAFFPLLTEQNFRQEGHRLEFRDPADSASPLEFKGVVYNEMKGAMADPSSLLGRRLNRHLFPTITYHHNSGGEPERIPDLTYQNLRDFHAAHYHPSNAWLFSYGNMNLEKHLATIQERALGEFAARRDVDTAVPSETRRSEPLQVTETFPVDPGEETARRSMVQVSWLACDIDDNFERLSLDLLAMLLLGNPAAPLYKNLLDSNLGSNLAPGAGYHDDYRSTFFAAGLQGTDPEHAGAIEKTVLETLEQAATEGFTRERIEGAIHRYEFSHREVSGDSYPYPLMLCMRMIAPWMHTGDAVNALQLSGELERLRREIDAGPFFENLIRRYLLDNPHRVTMTLTPDPEQKKEEEARTAERLQKIEADLSAADRERIVKQAVALQQAQEAEEDLSSLPGLERSDIPVEEQEVISSFSEESGFKVQWFDQPTNGIGYFVSHLDTRTLPAELLPYVPFFCALLTQIGAAGRSYLEMAQRLEAETGGVSASTEVLEDPDDPMRFRRLVQIKGKALVRKQDKLFEILTDIFTAPDFDDLTRLRTVLGQVRTSLENSIPGSGHSYAARSAAARLRPAARQREAWSGLELIALAKKISTYDDGQLREFADRMKTIAGNLLTRDHFACALVGEGRHFDEIRPALGSFLEKLPTKNQQTQAGLDFEPQHTRLGWIGPVPVSYVTRVFPTVPFNHPDAAGLIALAKLLRAGFLHREIREKGGAYGGLAVSNPETGLFSMLSYRDPHLSRTLNVFDQAAEWAAAGRFSDEEIKEAILGVFSDLDKPLSPAGRGFREFSNTRQGLTLEMRQQLRRRALDVDRETLMRLAKTYLVEGRSGSAVAVLSNEERLRQAESELKEEKLELRRI